MKRLFENLGSVKLPKLSWSLPLDPTREVYSTPYEAPTARVSVGLRPSNSIFHEKQRSAKVLG